MVAAFFSFSRYLECVYFWVDVRQGKEGKHSFRNCHLKLCFPTHATASCMPASMAGLLRRSLILLSTREEINSMVFSFINAVPPKHTHKRRKMFIGEKISPKHWLVCRLVGLQQVHMVVTIIYIGTLECLIAVPGWLLTFGENSCLD